MRTLFSKIRDFLRKEEGAEMVEWVIVVAILAAIALAVYAGDLNTAISGAISTIASIIGAAG